MLSATATNPAFEISLPDGIVPKGPSDFAVTYRPASELMERELGSFTITTDVPGLTATFTVSGQPTNVDCTMPQVIDFGGVQLTTPNRLELMVENATRFETTAFVDGPTPVTFTAGETFFHLDPGERHAVAIFFNPADPGEYRGSVGVKRHQTLCDEQRVTLIGTGVATPITWDSPVLNFDDVAIGATATRTVTFSNHLSGPVTLTSLAAREGSTGPSTFSVSVSSLALPPAHRNEAGEMVPGISSIEVSFTPTAAGPRGAQLTASAPFITQPTVGVNLRGTGTP